MCVLIIVIFFLLLSHSVLLQTQIFLCRKDSNISEMTLRELCNIFVSPSAAVQHVCVLIKHDLEFVGGELLLFNLKLVGRLQTSRFYG